MTLFMLQYETNYVSFIAINQSSLQFISLSFILVHEWVMMMVNDGVQNGN